MQVTAPFHVAFLRLEPERLLWKRQGVIKETDGLTLTGGNAAPCESLAMTGVVPEKREYVQTWRRGSSTIPDSPSPDERGGNLDINSSTKELDEAGHHLLQSPVAPKRPQEASKDKIVRIV